MRTIRSTSARCLAALAALGCATVLFAQGAARLATNAEALVAAPVFFHGRQIAVRHEVEPDGRLFRLAKTTKPVFVFFREAPSLASDVEIRGEFWDLGRLQKDDPRLSGIDVAAIVDQTPGHVWPGRDQMFVILNAATVDSPLPDQPTLRALALAPEHYVGKGVTLAGRFRGANLMADLPESAGTQGRWDFVLQSADAAVWVTGVRPRGKGFDLDVNLRADTGRWLQVAGTVRRDGPLAYILATDVQAATAPADAPVEVVMPRAPEPPPTVVFSVPTAGESDADPTSHVRIQFSRDMDAKTFKGHVQASYAGAVPPGSPPAPPPLTTSYNEGTRALDIRFAAPLDHLRTVTIDLTDGIKSAIDGLPLAPWSMTFTTGG